MFPPLHEKVLLILAPPIFILPSFSLALYVNSNPPLHFSPQAARCEAPGTLHPCDPCGTAGGLLEAVNATFFPLGEVQSMEQHLVYAPQEVESMVTKVSLRSWMHHQRLLE